MGYTQREVHTRPDSYNLGYDAGWDDWCVGYDEPQVRTPEEARKLLKGINEFRRDVYGDPGYAGPDGKPLEPIDINAVDLSEFIRGYLDGFEAAREFH